MVTFPYDYLIVGAGLFGSILARELTDSNKKCLVIEKRNHIGGNCYSEEIEGIHVSKYGGHIFHTNNKRIWDYVNRFATFRQYYHIVRVAYKDEIYSFPINLMTLNQLWGVKTPQEAMDRLEEERVPIKNPKNLEEWALSQVGREVYEVFIKGYTKKFWKRDPKELPSFIIKRLPIRLNYENGYFTDKYQGFPEEGYTHIFYNLLEGIEVRKGVDFFADKEELLKLAPKVVYTGKIDQYYKFHHGHLEYHTLKFVNKTLKGDHQGCATINYTDEDVPYNRITEHKHFQSYKKNNKTVITIEYSDTWAPDKVPYYPINDDKNNSMYKKYKALTKEEKNVIFGGRLAEYKYYDMDKVVASALKQASIEKKQIGENT